MSHQPFKTHTRRWRTVALDVVIMLVLLADLALQQRSKP